MLYSTTTATTADASSSFHIHLCHFQHVSLVIVLEGSPDRAGSYALISLIAFVRVKTGLILAAGIVLEISWFHAEPAYVRQAGGNTLLVLDVLFAEKVQQRYFLHQYSVVEKFPASDCIYYEAHGIGQRNLRGLKENGNNATMISKFRRVIYLCAYRPIEPSHVGRVSHPTINTVRHQLVLVMSFELNLKGKRAI